MCSRSVAFVAFSDGKPVSTFPENALEQGSRTLFISIRDRVGAHIGERLDRQRWIEAAHRGEGGAADDEEIRDIPALAVAVHHRGLRVAPHARAAFVMGAG